MKRLFGVLSVAVLCVALVCAASDTPRTSRATIEPAQNDPSTDFCITAEEGDNMVRICDPALRSSFETIQRREERAMRVGAELTPSGNVRGRFGLPPLEDPTPSETIGYCVSWEGNNSFAQVCDDSLSETVDSILAEAEAQQSRTLVDTRTGAETQSVSFEVKNEGGQCCVTTIFCIASTGGKICWEKTRCSSSDYYAPGC